MNLDLKTQIKIKGSAEQIWNVLLDFEKYREWNPFILKAEGEVKKGSFIHIEMKDMKFKPEILVFQKDSELRWKGKVLLKGLFDGEHIFKIIDNGNTCTFLQEEKFSGILVGLFKNKLLKNTKASFIAMNEALKLRVENL